MKKNIFLTVSFLLVISIVIFGLFTYQHHQQLEKAKQEREKYERSRYYTGKWEIDFSRTCWSR